MDEEKRGTKNLVKQLDENMRILMAHDEEHLEIEPLLKRI
jgi:hypothetical protein